MRQAWMMVVALMLAVPAWAGWPTGVPAALSARDEAAYKVLFREAHKGRWDNAKAKAVADRILLGHAQAVLYLESSYPTGYGELVAWLNTYGEYPEAGDVYSLALKKMPRAKRVCKGKGKARKCHTEGKNGTPPPLPQAVIERKLRQEAAEKAREREYDGLNPVQVSARREALSQSWRYRSGKKWQQALDLLRQPQVRGLLNDSRWQNELVEIAEAQLVKQDWTMMRAAGELAAKTQGARRDEALWLAGMGYYRSGNARKAAGFWRMLAEEHQAWDLYTARAAWWAARAYEETGQRADATRMLQLAARDTTAFYGILAIRKLGGTPRYDWSSPQLNAGLVKEAMEIRTVRRGLALAQVGEGDMAQMVFYKAKDGDIPLKYVESLAAFGLKANLPAIAVDMGRELYKAGKLVPAALYPTADMWQPQSPRLIDRPLLLAITRQESLFHPRIGSRVGAQGLMQLMPATARFIVRKTGRGSSSDLHNPANNMTLGHDYLAHLKGETEGDLIAMVAGYNGGPGNVRKWQNKPIASAADPLMFVESIPFDETRGYVMKVLSNLWVYESRLNRDAWSLASLSRNVWPRRFMALAPDPRDIGG